LTQSIGGEQALSVLTAPASPVPAANFVLKANVQKRHTAATPFDLSVDLGLPTGITILFGASGAGKTTLLDCLAGLIRPDAGKIELGAQVWFDSSAGLNVPVPRRNVGYVFQDLALFPHLSVQANVEYGLHALSSSERSKRSDQILDAFRIAHLRERRPRQISGGEAQRVALARSLVTNPNLLLLDEPLAGLDAPTKSKIVEDLRGWNQSHSIPMLYVTHSQVEVLALGERVVVLDRGRVIAQGTPHEVMTMPRQETVAQLAGFENIFDALVTATHEDRGTMTCSVGVVQLETPLIHAEVGSQLRVGIRAGDILLAVVRPEGLSARNVLPGRVLSLARRDMVIAARVDCGAEFEVHLTLAARDALQLSEGRQVWLVVKTHSCHLMAS
jgi:molybdate transport system ATP-binding protein